MEIALLRYAAENDTALSPAQRDLYRRAINPFDPHRKMMSTVDEVDGVTKVHVKGAPEAALPRCVGWAESTAPDRVRARLDELTARGLRVLAVAWRDWDADGRPDPGNIGLTSNRLLLAGCVFEIVFAAALVYLPPPQDVFGTAALVPWMIALVLPFPILVWGADEILRWRLRRCRPPVPSGQW
ncbi:cation transporting ATPase C-terminal domain-containing protein [Nocardia brevicatena]|uniref:cation transporting ATPase C-terminal domain-containing protein n=1 Tax=Nocardia brevicatena TaxID=37327 RepID=UPI0002D8FE8D|nr:cation-translocating P-type ATPase C-terminal domain-containing protein [Nocardia brevicatena]